jgi:PST family polysaccharide transporter
MNTGNVSGSRQDANGASGTYGRVAKVGVVWSFTQKLVGQSGDLLASVLLARLLTPTDFGIAAATGFFLRLANKVANFGLGGALLRLKEMRPEHISTVFVVNLGVGVISWLALTLSAPLLALVFRTPEVAPALRVAAIVYLVLPFGTGQLATISREMRFRDAAIIDWVYSAFFLCTSVPLAWFGFGFWSLIYAQLGANAVQALTKMYLGGRQPRLRFSKEALRETIPFGAGLYAKRLISFAAGYLDSLIVGRVLGMAALGLYDKAFNTVDRVAERLNAPVVFLRIFTIIQDEADRFRRAYLKACLVATFVGFSVFATLIVIAPHLIEVLYGRQWLAAVIPFQILCVAGASRVTLAYASAAIQASGKIWSETWRHGIYALLIVLGVSGFSVWGIVGAAGAVALASICMMTLMQGLVCSVTGLGWTDIGRSQLPGAVAAATLAGSLLGVEMLIRTIASDPRPWQILLAQLATAAVVMPAFIFLGPFGSIREVSRETLEELAPGLAKYLPLRLRRRGVGESATAPR